MSFDGKIGRLTTGAQRNREEVKDQKTEGKRADQLGERAEGSGVRGRGEIRGQRGKDSIRRLRRFTQILRKITILFLS
jgi:hypothetical protein